MLLALAGAFAQVGIGGGEFECPVVEPGPVGRAVTGCVSRKCKQGENSQGKRDRARQDQSIQHADTSQKCPSGPVHAADHGANVGQIAMTVPHQRELK